MEAKGGTAKRATGARTRPAPKPEAPTPAFRIRALDPIRKCGPRTTVQALYRLDEQVKGESVHHLVFLDRHGWYCEHGPACPAVAQAKKFDRFAGSPRTRLQTVG